MSTGSSILQRWPLIVGVSTLLVLALFAWRYYLERTACFDSAFFSWLVIDDAAPASVLGRYGSWLAQLLPVLMIHLDASLETVLRTYSVSFILLHLFVFLWILLGLKDRKGAIALPMVLTAAFHYMFYYGISELYQGLVLSVLLWTLMRRFADARERTAQWGWAIAILLLNAWISTYHQLLVLPLFFLVVLEWLQQGRWPDRRTWLLHGLLLGWYVLRIKVLTASTYEASRMLSLSDVLTHVRHINDLTSATYLGMVWTKFKAFHLLALATVVLAVRQRTWWMLSWTVAYSAGVLALALIVDRDMATPILCENYYPVVGFLWAVLFATLIGSGPVFTGKQVLAIAVPPLVCALGLLQIHRGHYLISEKVAYSERITTFHMDHGSRKIVVLRGNYPWSYALGHWAEGFGSALATGVEGPTRVATSFVPDEGWAADSAMKDPFQFLGPSWSPTWFGIQNLDHRYFDLPTDVGYTWANTPDTGFAFARLELQAPRQVYRMVPDRYTVVPVAIHNPTDHRMPSLDSTGTPLRFRYTLRDAEGRVYQEGAERSAMETDIPAHATYEQGIVIERPNRSGRYSVELVLEGTSVVARFEVVADRWPL